jgi:hypothetical protein
MKALLVISTTLITSLQATGEMGRGILSGVPEPALIALWGIALLTLATSARNASTRSSETKKVS